MAEAEIEMIVTNGEGIGEKVNMKYDTETTVTDVARYLTEKFGALNIQLFLHEGGVISLCDHSLEVTGEKKLCSLVMPSWSYPISLTKYKEEITLRAIALNGESMLLKVHESDTVMVLKWQIQQKTKVLIDDQKLTFSSSMLYESDLDTLDKIGVKSFSTVRVELEMKGGGIEIHSPFAMVDVFQDSARRILHWSTDAPFWRSVVPGLVLEGTCTNIECEAHLQNVFCSRRFGTFDMRHQKVCCPSCRMRYTIKNAGFNNCFYSVRGVKTRLDFELYMPWTKVGNNYQTWDPHKGGVENWSFLQIVTKPLHKTCKVPGGSGKEAPVAEDCAICYDRISQKGNVEMLSCAHSFHHQCWIKWQNYQKKHYLKVRCPLCRSR